MFKFEEHLLHNICDKYSSLPTQKTSELLLRRLTEPQSTLLLDLQSQSMGVAFWDQ
jgi:hypothetical protein